MKTEIALDLKRYSDNIRLSSLSQDTASLAIEASSNPDIPRVNVTFLAKNKDQDKVVAPGRDKRDVREMFVLGDPLSEAGNYIARNLEEDPEDFVYFWISPSDPFPEARIQAGSKQTTKSRRADFIKRYDISSKATPQECLSLGQLLASMAENEVEFPQHPGQLGTKVFKLRTPQGINPFEFVKDILEDRIPERQELEKIIDKTVDRNKAKILKTSHKVTKAISENPHYIMTNPIYYGAYIETQMAREGFEMDPDKFGCGISNVSISGSGISGTETFSGINGYTEGQSKYVKNCGKCGAVIEANISAGYVCSSCDGVYLGC